MSKTLVDLQAIVPGDGSAIAGSSLLGEVPPAPAGRTLGDFTELLSGHGDVRQVIPVPLAAIAFDSPVQTRAEFDPEDPEDREFMNSISTHGVIQPVLLCREGDDTQLQYRIIEGHRRVAACRYLGLERIPALVYTVDEVRAAEITVIANLQRRDLNPMEQARQYEALMRLSGMTPEQLAERVGKSRRTIYRYLSLLKLTPELQEMVQTGRLSFKQALQCAQAPPEKQAEVATLAERHNLSAPAIQHLIAAVGENPDAPVAALAHQVAGERTPEEARASRRRKKGKASGKAPQEIDYRRYTLDLDPGRREELEATAREMQLDGITVRRAALLLRTEPDMPVPAAVAYAQQLGGTEVGRALASIEAGVERFQHAARSTLTPGQRKAAVLVAEHIKIWTDEIIALLRDGR